MADDCSVIRLADRYFAPPLARGVQEFGHQVGEMTPVVRPQPPQIVVPPGSQL